MIDLSKSIPLIPPYLQEQVNKHHAKKSTALIYSQTSGTMIGPMLEFKYVIRMNQDETENRDQPAKSKEDCVILSESPGMLISTKTRKTNETKAEGGSDLLNSVASRLVKLPQGNYEGPDLEVVWNGLHWKNIDTSPSGCVVTPEQLFPKRPSEKHQKEFEEILSMIDLFIKNALSSK